MAQMISMIQNVRTRQARLSPTTFQPGEEIVESRGSHASYLSMIRIHSKRANPHV